MELEWKVKIQFPSITYQNKCKLLKINFYYLHENSKLTYHSLYFVINDKYLK